MATIQMIVGDRVDATPKTYFYDPDGPNSPLTLQFPLSTDTSVPNGARIRIVNQSTSNTSVTLLCQGTDVVASPVETMSFAASQVITTPELTLQYQLDGTEWRIISHGDPDLGKQALQIFSFAAYANMLLAAGPVASGDIGATWTDINVFDTDALSPRGILTDITSGTMSFEHDGIYRMSVLLNYTHNESNSSRVTNLRLYNVSDATAASEGIIIPISRNQPATLVSVSFLFEVTEANKNKLFVLQIGNGDVLSTVVVNAADWSANAVSEWREPLV